MSEKVSRFIEELDKASWDDYVNENQDCPENIHYVETMFAMYGVDVVNEMLREAYDVAVANKDRELWDNVYIGMDRKCEFVQGDSDMIERTKYLQQFIKMDAEEINWVDSLYDNIGLVQSSIFMGNVLEKGGADVFLGIDIDFDCFANEPSYLRYLRETGNKIIEQIGHQENGQGVSTLGKCLAKIYEGLQQGTCFKDAQPLKACQMQFLVLHEKFLRVDYGVDDREVEGVISRENFKSIAARFFGASNTKGDERVATGLKNIIDLTLEHVRDAGFQERTHSMHLIGQSLSMLKDIDASLYGVAIAQVQDELYEKANNLNKILYYSQIADDSAIDYDRLVGELEKNPKRLESVLNSICYFGHLDEGFELQLLERFDKEVKENPENSKIIVYRGLASFWTDLPIVQEHMRAIENMDIGIGFWGNKAGVGGIHGFVCEEKYGEKWFDAKSFDWARDHGMDLNTVCVAERGRETTYWKAIEQGHAEAISYIEENSLIDWDRHLVLAMCRNNLNEGVKAVKHGGKFDEAFFGDYFFDSEFDSAVDTEDSMNVRIEKFVASCEIQLAKEEKERLEQMCEVSAASKISSKPKKKMKI